MPERTKKILKMIPLAWNPHLRKPSSRSEPRVETCSEGRTSPYTIRESIGCLSIQDGSLNFCTTASLAMSTQNQRIGVVERVTKETDVWVKINLNGNGVANSNTSIPFLDHMLDQLASHGLFDVQVKATGDIHIDDHHTNEDVALALGTALLQALGGRKGINRFGDFSAPLDEALIHVSLDLSGRPHLSYDLNIPTERVGTYDTQIGFSQLAGKNSHHIIEATFKAFARALRQATEYDLRRLGTVPSSKGVLSRS
ncbi:hypothetical protein V6N13_051146 [Hibiscus sabdariffa]